MTTPRPHLPLLALTLSLLAAPWLAARAEIVPPVSTVESLEAALRSGELDEARYGLHLLQLVHAPEQLPPRFRRPAEGDLFCLTPHLIRARQALRDAPPEIQQQAQRLLADPPPETAGFLEAEDLPVRVYYQEEEDLELAENMLSVVEAGYIAHVEEMGWTVPTTLDDDGETPVARLDIYLVDTANEYAGFCEPLGNNDETSWTDAITRCQINRSGDHSMLEATVTHELDHAFQQAEDSIEFFGAYEMFAVYTTHHILTNDPYWLYFLPNFQSEPHRPMHLPSMSNQLYHYGSALFAEFLDERYGEGDGQIGARLWQAARQDGEVSITSDSWVTSVTPNEPDLFDVIDAELRREHDSSFDQALVEFAHWRLLLGARDDGAHFADGASWRSAEVQMASTFDPDELPVEELEVLLPPAPTGTSYIEVETDDLENGEQLRLGVDLDDDTRWAVQVIRQLDGEPAEISAMELDDEEGELTVAAAGTEAVILAVTNLGPEGFDADDYPLYGSTFNYSLELLSQAVVESIEPAAATAGTNGVEVVVRAAPLSPEATLSLGEGVTVTSVEVVDGALEAVVDLDLEAPIGTRDVTVTNPEADPGVLAGGFEVLAPPAPTLTGVEPRLLSRGESTVLTVRGSGLLEGAEAAIGEGVEVEHADVIEAGRMLLTVTVADDAGAGPRALTVTNPGGQASRLDEAVEVVVLAEAGCSCRAGGTGAELPGGGVALLLLVALGLAWTGRSQRRARSQRK